MENTDRNNPTAPSMSNPPPYYPQPGFGYPGQPATNYYQSSPPQKQQHQQQQQVVLMNNQPMGVAPVVVVGAPPVSMVGPIVLSCFVFWCCGWLFGGIAFILAMVGQSSDSAGDTRGAIQMRNASYGLSIAGIIIGIILIIVAAVILGSAAKAVVSTPKQCYNSYYGYYYTC